MRKYRIKCKICFREVKNTIGDKCARCFKEQTNDWLDSIPYKKGGKQ